MILEITTSESLPTSEMVLPPNVSTNHYQCRQCSQIYHAQIVCPKCMVLTQPWVPILTDEDELELLEMLENA